MTAPDDLASWLLEQVAEEQEAARKLERRAQEHALHIQEPNLLGRVIPGWHDWPDIEAMAHRVAAECEAKRRIIELHDEDTRTVIGSEEVEWLGTCGVCCEPSKWDHFESAASEYPCMTLRLLALPYADRPGYQERWRP